MSKICYAVEVYNVYDVTVKQLAIYIQLNFEQNIEALSKILCIIGQKKELPKRKQVKIKAKQTDL